MEIKACELKIGDVVTFSTGDLMPLSRTPIMPVRDIEGTVQRIDRSGVHVAFKTEHGWTSDCGRLAKLQVQRGMETAPLKIDNKSEKVNGKSID